MDSKPRRSIDGIVSGSIHRGPDMPGARRPDAPLAGETVSKRERPIDGVVSGTIHGGLQFTGQSAPRRAMTRPEINKKDIKNEKKVDENPQKDVQNPEKAPNSDTEGPILLQENEPMPKDGKVRRRLLLTAGKKSLKWLKWLLITVLVVGLVGGAVAGFVGYNWYSQQIKPASTDTSKRVNFEVKQGEGPKIIAKNLEDAGLIRSAQAFLAYKWLNNRDDTLKAGIYSLQPSLPVSSILKKLIEGKQETFSVTFLPGDTLANAKKSLLATNLYTETQIDAALAKNYSSPLFDGKPAGTDLEGYFYGETIEFYTTDSVETVLQRFFDEFAAFVKDNDLQAKYKKQGLTLYQGITLASIVTREVNSADDAKQVARVFMNRMAKGMNLGSDVTYQYAADKAGVPRTPDLDSPYNTRKFVGLPPGPIATPGNSALLAVASPSTNDYLFFLSGDDDVTYFAKTDAEHQKNITDHCAKKCQIM